MMKKVYVGLSGGVDSSVSAALLKRQGYDVTGVYMKNWTRDVAGVACPWADDLHDARTAAAVLDIPFKVFDFQDHYRERVVEVMMAEYVAGRTPNPDVLCNQDIKFSLFLATALADGAEMIATGHYAQTKGGQLMKAVDEQKDQTYFLYRVTSDALRKTLFPVGHLTKPKVRALAAEFGLPAATKPDSQGICFVGEVGIKAFLSEYVDSTPGPIMHCGVVIGQHDGAIFYTIGQRHGLGVGGGKPYYVTGKDMAKNIVYVTERADELVRNGSIIELTNTHWIGDNPREHVDHQVRIRHQGKLIVATVTARGDQWLVRLNGIERAIASGQSLVVYRDATVIGGGMVSKVVVAVGGSGHR